jgi:hypothetical protein
MKKILASFFLALLIAMFLPCALQANDPTSALSTKSPVLQYKVIAGFKQPFNDDFQLHLSKGWMPVGGVSVTVWNSDLYFAQLIAKRVDSLP